MNDGSLSVLRLQTQFITWRLSVVGCRFIAILFLERMIRQGVSVWPVYVAQVDYILPRIKNESFDEEKFSKNYSIVVLGKV
jgi:hypothetical protein